MRSAVDTLKLRLASLILALSLVTCALPSGGTQVAVQPDLTFSADQAYSHVRYLSETIGPRVASTPAERTAADYIAEQFRSSGLSVVRQRFEFSSWEEKKVQIEVIQPPLGNLKANSMLYSAPGEVVAEIVDGGDGSAQDFRGKSVAGKIALIKRGEIPFATKVSNAASAGAVGAVIYNNAEGELKGRFDKPSSIPAVGIARDDGERLLVALSSGVVRVRLLVDAEITPKTSENVIGTKPVRGGRAVILSAHYDSVQGSPGANDNGSGVATIVELARVTANASYLFELRFIAFGAEEPGLIGSERYVKSLTEGERKQIKAILNFDMVGVGDEIGFGGDPDLVAHALSLARDSGVEAAELNPKLLKASDQASFMDVGIPVLMVYWREDPHYHTSDDRAEFVDPDKLGITGKTALGILARSARTETVR